MPVNALIIRALMHYFAYYGDNFKIECPTGSGNLMNLFEVAREIANRLTRIFLRDESGRRPVFGGAEKFQRDPHWRDNLLFYEYFHGDNGAGIGASHQTGWTGVVAGLIDIFGKLDAETFLQGGREAAFRPRDRDGVGDDHGDRAALSVPFSDQHPGLASAFVPRSRQTNHPGRYRRRHARRFAEQGFDWIWLLSVWQIGAAGRAVSRGNPQWRAEFRRVLPDLTEDDICGSGFAITAYTVSEALGGESGVGPVPRKAGETRHQADARFRAEPYRPRPSVGEDPSRLLCRRQRGGVGRRAAKLSAGRNRPRTQDPGLWPRSEFPWLARHLAAQLRQS